MSQEHDQYDLTTNIQKVLAVMQTGGDGGEDGETVTDEEERETIHVYPVAGGGILLTRTPIIDDEDLETTPLFSQPAPQPASNAAAGILLFGVFVALLSLMFQFYLIVNPFTVTITLAAKEQQLSFTGRLQLGRVLSPITLSQSQTSLTTGKGHQDAKAASGTVTFYNGSNTAHTINAGTVFTGNDGIQVATDQDATIPAANLPVVGQATVTAHALKANAKGNIQAYDVNLAISSDLTVKNLSHFTGGQDERTFQTVTKQDISNVAMTLKISLAQSMRGALTGQVQSGEALVTPPCTPQVTADHRPGEEATRVKVTVSETCSAVTYDTQSLNTRVTQLLTTQAAETLGTGYSLIGGVRVSGIQATITHKQHPLVFLSFHSQGIWVYALSQRAQQRIKTLIAGKTKQEAVHLLESQPGIERVSLHWSGFGDDTRIPKNISYIHLALFYGL